MCPGHHPHLPYCFYHFCSWHHSYSNSYPRSRFYLLPLAWQLCRDLNLLQCHHERGHKCHGRLSCPVEIFGKKSEGWLSFFSNRKSPGHLSGTRSDGFVQSTCIQSAFSSSRQTLAPPSRVAVALSVRQTLPLGIFILRAISKSGEFCSRATKSRHAAKRGG